MEQPTRKRSAATYVIIGNGIAGITAAETLRAEDNAANIVVVSDDPAPVYYRPALKDYLAGRVSENKLPARSEHFYREQRINFVCERVIAIQPDQRLLRFQSGRQGKYTRLLLASGAQPATLRCPGINLPGVTTLRTLDDYRMVQERLLTARHIVVAGSGTLALETVETLRHRGYSVSHLLRRRTLWSEVLDATASDLVLQQERRDGVDVRLEEEIAQITGTQQVEGVMTTKGEYIACDLVIIAIGIVPAIDFARTCGIACSRGVYVDETLRTSVPNIYAAGDILEIPDPITRRNRVLGQWYPAIQQARAAAYSMLDRLDSHYALRPNNFYNASMLYGLDFAATGSSNAQGLQELRAEPAPRTYRKVILKDGIPVGMLLLGDRHQGMAFKRAIDHRVNLLPVAKQLFAADFNLNNWLDQQGVPRPHLSTARKGVSTELHIEAIAAEGAKRVETTMLKPVLEKRPAPPVAASEAVLLPHPTARPYLQWSEFRIGLHTVVKVGREMGVHLMIDEGTVSRRHAEIRYENGNYILNDLGSTNGTYINGKRIQPNSPYILQADDKVRFGKVIQCSFTLRVPAPA